MRHKKNQAKYFYMFIMPWFLGFFLLTFMPLVYSIYLSLTQYNGISMPKFIGLRNYIDLLFYDDLFRKSLFNSFHYAVLAVPTSLILALFMAFLLSKEIKISNIFQIIFYFPSIAAGAAVFAVIKYLLRGEGGLINNVFVFNLVMGIIGAFQVFVQPLIMTEGGPFKKTYMYGMYIYDSGFSHGRFGYAAALAWIMYIIILFISLVILRSLKKLMNYTE